MRSVDDRTSFLQANIQSYINIVSQGALAFREVFLHLRDKPLEGILIHCAAGKDRTGVAVALILSLAGVEDTLIAEEYALTESGLEAMKPMILKYLEKIGKLQWGEEKVQRIVSAK